MTIFDAIKYPISIPPESGEFKNLPYEIFNKWSGRLPVIGSFIPPVTYKENYDAYFNITYDKSDIIFLRKLIAEWNNDNI